MNESVGQAWGTCAAFGCPLFGTVGSDGRWYCYCHAGRPSSVNDAITQMLHSHMPIVDAALSIRRHFSSFREDPDAYRAIQRALREHSREDLLFGKPDESPHRPGKPIVKQWLARLERELISLTVDLGQQRLRTGMVPTAPIIGPTHALQHYSEKGEA